MAVKRDLIAKDWLLDVRSGTYAQVVKKLKACKENTSRRGLVDFTPQKQLQQIQIVWNSARSYNSVYAGLDGTLGKELHGTWVLSLWALQGLPAPRTFPRMFQ